MPGEAWCPVMDRTRRREWVSSAWWAVAGLPALAHPFIRPAFPLHVDIVHKRFLPYCSYDRALGILQESYCVVPIDIYQAT